MNKHADVFTGQSQSVVSYFDESTQQAHNRLQAAEQKLAEFNKTHNIADYDRDFELTASENQKNLDKQNDLEMQQAGALSSLRSVEQRLRLRGGSNLQGQQIITQRNQLANLTNQITELEGLNNPANNARIANLKKEVTRVSNRMESTLNSYVPGISTSSLPNDYIANTILVEDLKSKLSLLKRQQSATAEAYNKLVPLAAESRRLKRELEVAEKEYLAQMDGLKQSRLTQQNVQISSQLKVVDPPNTPTSPVKSTTMMLVLFGFFGTLLLTTAGIIAADMLDGSLRKPSTAAKLTNFPVLGVLPETTGVKGKLLPDVNRAKEQFARQLLLKYHKNKESDAPYVVGVLSSLAGEGKSSVCNTLATSLNSMGIDTLTLLPESHANQVASEENVSFYSPLHGVTPGITVADLAGPHVFNYSIIIIEFPAVLENAYPVSLLQHLDLILVTVNAKRTWQQADKTIFENIQEVTKAPIEVVLNSVSPEFVEEFAGARVKPTNDDGYMPSNVPKKLDHREERAALNS